MARPLALREIPASAASRPEIAEGPDLVGGISFVRPVPYALARDPDPPEKRWLAGGRLRADVQR